MTAPEDIFGLVLAGGKSTRMGSDKALLRQEGETQLSRAVKLLEAHLDHVFVSTRARGNPVGTGLERGRELAGTRLRSAEY
jgi:molybdopterin-guanine dinucleotide biosynthesis protein A